MRGRAGPFFAALALAGVVALAVFPTRAWFDQRANRQELTAQLAALTDENRALEDRAALLRSDEEIERLARGYNLVKPGEETYFIRPRAGVPAEAAPAPPPPERESESLWDRIASMF